MMLLPVTSESISEILVSWSAVVSSSVSTLCSNSATELFPSLPKSSSKTVTRKSNVSVVAVKPAAKKQTSSLVQYFLQHMQCTTLNGINYCIPSSSSLIRSSSSSTSMDICSRLKSLSSWMICSSYRKLTFQPIRWRLLQFLQPESPKALLFLLSCCFALSLQLTFSEH